MLNELKKLLLKSGLQKVAKAASGSKKANYGVSVSGSIGVTVLVNGKPVDFTVSAETLKGEIIKTVASVLEKAPAPAAKAKASEPIK